VRESAIEMQAQQRKSKRKPRKKNQVTHLVPDPAALCQVIALVAPLASTKAVLQAHLLLQSPQMSLRQSLLASLPVNLLHSLLQSPQASQATAQVALLACLKGLGVALSSLFNAVEICGAHMQVMARGDANLVENPRPNAFHLMTAV